MEKTGRFYDAYPEPPLISPDTTDKSIYLAHTLETSWRKLPMLFNKLNLKQQLGYKRRLLGKHESPVSYFSSWETALTKSIPTTQDEAANNTIPAHELNETEARVKIMSSVYEELLLDLNEIRKDHEKSTLDPVSDKRVAAFIWILRAFKSSLPVNRTGHNAITLESIPLDTAKQGYEYIRELK